MLILEFSAHNFCYWQGIINDCLPGRQWMSGEASVRVLTYSMFSVMRRDHPAEPCKTSLISWFRICCPPLVVILLKERCQTMKKRQLQQRDKRQQFNYSFFKKIHCQFLPQLNIILFPRRLGSISSPQPHHRLPNVNQAAAILQGR